MSEFYRRHCNILIGKLDIEQFNITALKGKTNQYAILANYRTYYIEFNTMKHLYERLCKLVLIKKTVLAFGLDKI
jgi:hypothetical protein